MARFEDWSEQRAGELIARHAQQEGAALPILHALQETFGYIHRDAVRMLASALNLSRAELHGLVTFYHDFRSAPPGGHVLKLCRAEACQSMGADALAAQAREKLRVDWRGTTVDKRVTLEPVFCLGLCACAPAAMLDGQVFGRLNPKRLDALIERTNRT
ncbi:MAG: formate dehydrogenase subunit gamma [Alphaproteobacteria bacterium]|nr:formate dehydrogenase subunit gamma [Alphaproteobacteria bacterium]